MNSARRIKIEFENRKVGRLGSFATNLLPKNLRLRSLTENFASNSLACERLGDDLLISRCSSANAKFSPGSVRPVYQCRANGLDEVMNEMSCRLRLSEKKNLHSIYIQIKSEFEIAGNEDLIPGLIEIRMEMMNCESRCCWRAAVDLKSESGERLQVARRM